MIYYPRQQVPRQGGFQLWEPRFISSLALLSWPEVPADHLLPASQGGCQNSWCLFQIQIFLDIVVPFQDGLLRSKKPFSDVSPSSHQWLFPFHFQGWLTCPFLNQTPPRDWNCHDWLNHLGEKWVIRSQRWEVTDKKPLYQTSNGDKRVFPEEVPSWCRRAFQEGSSVQRHRGVMEHGTLGHL